MERTIIDILGWAGTILYLIAYGLISAKKSGRRLMVVSRLEHRRRNVFDHQHFLSARVSVCGAEHRLGRNCVSHFGSKSLEEIIMSLRGRSCSSPEAIFSL